MAQKKAYIVSTGSYLPKKVLSNHDLEKMVDTTDDWIVTRTGMRERRIAEDDEFVSDMGFKSATIALERSGISADQLDLIIVATLSPDYMFPSTASVIQEMLQAKNAAAFDVSAACTGMVYALATAKAFVASGMYKNVLVVAAEKLSSVIDYQDRNTCVLFGDGASTCIVSDEGPGLEIGGLELGCDGRHTELLYMPAGGCRKPADKGSIEAREHFLKMEGSEIFKHAVRSMEASAKSVLQKAEMDIESISYFLPHQANIRIIDAIAKRLSIPDDKMVKIVEKIGNTSAATCGIALDHLLTNEEIVDGDNLLLTAFGAGLTWGSLILKQVGGSA